MDVPESGKLKSKMSREEGQERKLCGLFGEGGRVDHFADTEVHLHEL